MFSMLTSMLFIDLTPCMINFASSSFFPLHRIVSMLSWFNSIETCASFLTCVTRSYSVVRGCCLSSPHTRMPPNLSQCSTVKK
ncbi:hypothetical protein BGW37DRAFT_488318 [Umbelopsis sp. PMI_123]|nr:hypothetical protein BGW37DRAFT_488318 [Umbelopsis sp. PMI_123]